MHAKHFLFAGLLLATTAGSALADGMMYSTTRTEYTIAYTEGSGKTSDATLSPGTDTLGYLAIPAKPGKPTPIVVKEQDGTVVAKGTVTDNQSYVLMGEGKGLKIVPAGLVAQTASSEYQGTAIVSALPGAYTIDLFGDSGQGGVKGVKPVASFNIKAATKLPASDNRYKAEIKGPDGTTAKALSSVDAGYYYVLHKNYEGKLTVSAAGHIAMPGK